MLASNTAEHGTSGSGIYACGHPIVSFFNYTADGLPDQKLLVGDVPKNPCDPLPQQRHLAHAAPRDATHHRITQQQEQQQEQQQGEEKQLRVASKAADDNKHCGTVGVDPCACDITTAAPGKT